MLNGLALQALTSEAALDGRQIREEVIRTLFPDAPAERLRSRNGRRARVGG